MHKRRGAIRLSKIAGLTAVGVVLTATGATAHLESADDGVIDSGKETHSHDVGQHGGSDGHIDVDNYGVELVSKLGLKNVEPGKIADVGVLGQHAYLAAWGGETCKYNGVHVVDISDVAAPREVAFVQAKEGSYPGEGVQALSISTPAFTGDILVTNNEQCKPGVGVGGRQPLRHQQSVAPDAADRRLRRRLRGGRQRQQVGARDPQRLRVGRR